MSFAKAFSPALREIRILCSQTGPASAGTRQFIQNNYLTIKQHNPDLPVLIREATGTPARVFARFEKGQEKHVELENVPAKDVESQILKLLQA
ncbi:thioredoxin-like protein [Schizophyllum commune]|uniref:Ribosomal protein/NADH dehydrogenase domain-containing protein n=1 Tax=Schizophyllum commune (strain H4-8 / FGSC 9210) TaxID=578458 RepID=D8QLV2_SCHCM|nr:NADH dehydrogenase, alpha subcomplex, subunit 2 [Schizophyllum commune H4-8]KAI4527803.1 NADH dehydrogenase, alpha subcomplex, subunit 2 [Schizophyllum commune Loenen D]KAI5831071.1 NADH dehydrogenase, alpha subcomplex, subunit 2 [Schizophyllum commune Tattone D]KAI5886657.1 NADH dehydrogenase, alpha subcomplex, subunit 2 [Schizophyllum commune H4-8]